MGACLSKQRVVAPVDKVAQLAGGAADETLAESGNAVNSASYTSQQPTTKDDLPSGPADYTGAIAPVCELQRRQHLLNFNILYTVSLVQPARARRDVLHALLRNMHRIHRVFQGHPSSTLLYDWPDRAAPIVHVMMMTAQGQGLHDQLNIVVTPGCW